MILRNNFFNGDDFLGRKVHLNEKEFVLELTGVNCLFAFKRRLKIPYQAITNVYVGEFKTPKGMVRTLGTSIPPSLCEGSFLYEGDYYFLSYERKVPLLQLEIAEYGKYRYVIFEIEDIHDLLIDLRKKIRESKDIDQGND